MAAIFNNNNDQHFAHDFDYKPGVRQALFRIMTELTEREATALIQYYGLDRGIGRTFAEVGLSFGVSRERIRQICDKAIGKLCHPSRSKLLKPYINN